MFSLYLGDVEEESKIFFGGYDQTIIDKSLEDRTDKEKEINKSENGIYWMDNTS